MRKKVVNEFVNPRETQNYFLFPLLNCCVSARLPWRTQLSLPLYDQPDTNALA